MKNSQWVVLLLAVSILLTSAKSVQLATAEQRASPDSAILDQRQILLFAAVITQKLEIDILILDRISLEEPGSVNDWENGLSKQDLLDRFIGFLRDNGALLIKSGIICQIVPSSRDLGNRWSPITALADIPSKVEVRQFASSIQRASNSLGPIRMINAGNSLPEFCTQIARFLSITPIVIDPAVKGSVTLTTSIIPREALFPILMVVLDNNDAVLVESKGEYQIVPKFKKLPEQWKVLTDLPPPPLPTKP